MKTRVLRILVAVFLFALLLVTFSLDVPPGDIPIFILMLVIAGTGLALTVRGSRKWRALWIVAAVITLVGGSLEIIAGKKIAGSRRATESVSAHTNHPPPIEKK